METRRRLTGYVAAVIVGLALIGWLTWGYTVKRGLVRDLSSNVNTVRVTAAQKLLKMKKLEATLPAQPIIRRSKTAQALGEIGTEDALRVLGIILRDQEEAPRRWARQALVKQGRQSVPIFMAALSATGGTLEEAVTGLTEIGQDQEDKEAARRIRAEVASQVRFLLTDRSAYGGAAQTLSRLGNVGVDALLSGCYNKDGKLRAKALGNLGLQRVKAALNPALDNLHPDWSPGDAIKALGLIGDRRATLAIIPFLTDKDNRTAAVTSLGQIGDARAVEPILATMEETEKLYRGAAILALQRIGAAAFPALTRELQSPDVLRRQGAAAALVGSASPQVTLALVAALGDSDEDVRASAARALGWSGNLAAVDPLVRTLADPSWQAVDAAVEALGSIGVHAIGRLVTVLSEPQEGLTVHYHVSRALAEMGSPAVPSLIAGLSNPDVEVKKWCAVALGDIGDLRAVEPLRALDRVAEGDLKWVVQERLRLLTGVVGS